MDKRLLKDEEVVKIMQAHFPEYNCALIPRKQNGAITQLIQAQDTKTRVETAREMIGELETLFPWIYQGTNKKSFESLKSRYGV